MREGGCQCGAVRYRITGEPLALYVCHCRECQKQSASAFGLSLEVPRAALRLTSGTPRRWTRMSDSGRRLACVFCPDCGSRLWHEAADGVADTLTIKAGSLDEPVDLTPAIHIWTARRLAGVLINERAKKYPGEPE
jgi:hypothetical protein